MNKKAVRRSQTDSIYKQINESRFLRYLVFADVIQRYSATILKNEVSWLKTAALLFIVTRGGSLAPSQLARIMLRSNYSITKLIDGLAKENLVMRRRDSKDRRVFKVYLTSTGIDFIENSLELLAKGEETVRGCLDDNEAKTLSDLSRKLRLKLIEQITGVKSVI